MTFGVVELCRYFNQEAFEKDVPMFRVESFIGLNPSVADVPDCEILLNHTDCEGFFRGVRSENSTVEMDLFLFRKVLENSNKGNHPFSSFSFNVDLVSALTPSFAERASLICSELGFNHQRITFEVTEHSPIPDAANLDILKSFQSCGFRLALDDFDPLRIDPVDRLEHISRFELLAPYVDMIKFDHKLIAYWMEGNAAEVLEQIKSYRKEYPGHIFILEGVSQQAVDNQNSYVHELVQAGIDVVQRFEPKQHRDMQADVPAQRIAQERACA